MYLTQSAKELKKYEAIAQKALSTLPPQISYRVVQVDDYNLSFKIYFGDFPTNFWITDGGHFSYREPEEGIYLKVEKNDLLKAFQDFLRDCFNNP